jgi:3-methyladenine DNA glycosylase AlkD
MSALSTPTRDHAPRRLHATCYPPPVVLVLGTLRQNAPGAAVTIRRVTADAKMRARAIEGQLRAIGTPERAANEKAYLKSNLEFAGTTVWQIRSVVKEIAAQGPPLDHEALQALVEALWTKPMHERRMAAVMLLELHPRLLGVEDLGLVERLVREAKTWALVDGLATDVVGRIALKHPVEITPILDRWATDPDFWVRRTSLLAELQPLRAGAPFDRFAAHADAMLDEREFFIRKAIGWVLRETEKVRPHEVIAWLAPRTHRASGVTMREAVRYLPEADATRLMAAYREKRPAIEDPPAD